jgi:hypothetical protein
VNPPHSVASSLHRHSTVVLPSRSFPVLLDIKRPLELQVGVVVVVDELGDSLVVATTEHARWGGLRLNCEERQNNWGQERAVHVHFFS